MRQGGRNLRANGHPGQGEHGITAAHVPHAINNSHYAGNLSCISAVSLEYVRLKVVPTYSTPTRSSPEDPDLASQCYLKLPYAEYGKYEHKKVRYAIEDTSGQDVRLIVYACSRDQRVPNLLSWIAFKY